MISKELLSEVLENEVPYQVRVHKIIIKNNSLNYFYNSKDNRSGLFETNEYINIYELAYKCKEWAFNNGYYLNIYNDAIDVVLKKSCKIVENITDGSFKYSPMLVFKACQWILDNKENK